MAAKNTMTLGLVTPTVNPSSIIPATVFRSTSAPSASASERRCRIACTPRKIRYAAPASLSTVNTATDRSTSAPIPNATAITCANAPTALPATVATPAARPSAIARLTTNSTLGPGIAISTNEVTVKASKCVVGITSPAYEAAPEEGHRVSLHRRGPAHGHCWPIGRPPTGAGPRASGRNVVDGPSTTFLRGQRPIDHVRPAEGTVSDGSCSPETA